MPREHRVHDLRHHRVVVSNNTRKYRTALAQPRHQVLAQLIFHPSRSETLLCKRTLAQFAESSRGTHGGKPPKDTALCRLYRWGTRSAFSHRLSVQTDSTEIGSGPSPEIYFQEFQLLTALRTPLNGRWCSYSGSAQSL